MEDLNDNELEALRILWEESPLKPAEIEARFGWPIDNGTLRSTLAVLMEKGHVERRKEGKAYWYSPKVERPSLLRSLTRRVARFAAGGSTADLVMELVRSEKFTAEQLAELTRIAESKQSPPSKKGGSR